MITEIIHFEILSSFEDNNIDLKFLKTIKLVTTDISMYRCYRYHELYAFGRIIEIVPYLFFIKERLIRVDYRIDIELFDFFKTNLNELLDVKFKLKESKMVDITVYEGNFKELNINLALTSKEYFIFEISHYV